VSDSRKVKVVILGAGPAALAAAWELSRTAELRGRFSITLYEQGFRAGGKCGGLRRPPHHTIEQNGTHYLFGCYDNAFDLVKQAYAALQAAGEGGFGTFEQEFMARHRMVFRHQFRGEFQDWSIELPPNDLAPGLGEGELDFLSRRHLATAMTWMWSRGASQLAGVLRRPELASSGWARRLYGSLSRLLALAPRGDHVPPERLRVMSDQLTRFRGFAFRLLRPWLSENLAVYRAWVTFDLAATCLVGLIRDDIQAPADLQQLNHLDLRDWLAGHGASRESLDSGPLRGWYDAVAAYRDGDTQRPSIAAGVSLYALGRAVLTYRGALFYSLRSEVADGFIAPICAALVRRGVRFAYFHRVWELVPDAAGTLIEAVELERQAELRGGDPCSYDPFVEVRGRKAWPAEPRAEQLSAPVDAAGLHSFYAARRGPSLRLERGRDFDALLFGMPLPTASSYCRRLLEQKAAWRRAIETLSSVETQSLRLYLSKSPEALGWRGAPGILSAFVPPFSTWEDNSHALEHQDWPAGNAPASIVSLFGALPGEAVSPEHDDTTYEARKLEQVSAAALHFLRHHGAALWPGARSAAGGFDFDTLLDLEARSGEARLAAQYLRANVGPNERYVTAAAGSLRDRLAPGASGYDNLYLAGDWTAQATGTGSVEGAVLSGRVAARALLARDSSHADAGLSAG